MRKWITPLFILASLVAVSAFADGEKEGNGHPEPRGTEEGAPPAPSPVEKPGPKAS